MNTKTLLSCALAVLVLANTGCASRDRRDAPWDPKPGAQLIDQIPNWRTQPCSKFCSQGS